MYFLRDSSIIAWYYSFFSFKNENPVMNAASARSNYRSLSLDPMNESLVDKSQYCVAELRGLLKLHTKPTTVYFTLLRSLWTSILGGDATRHSVHHNFARSCRAV